MDISYIEIDTGRLKNDTGELEAQISRISAQLESIMAEMEELNTIWKGQASRTFSAQVKSDYVIMQNMLSTMSKLTECMNTAGIEYERCENEVRSAVDSIRI